MNEAKGWGEKERRKGEEKGENRRRGRRDRQRKGRQQPMEDDDKANGVKCEQLWVKEDAKIQIKVLKLKKMFNGANQEYPGIFFFFK